jgi:hypothetical protein
MRFHLRGPRRAWPVRLLPALLCATIITGCDSRPNPDSPEAKQQIQARQEQVQKGVDEANALMRRRQGKKAEVLKSFKGGGGIKLGQPESQ